MIENAQPIPLMTSISAVPASRLRLVAVAARAIALGLTTILAVAAAGCGRFVPEQANGADAKSAASQGAAVTGPKPCESGTCWVDVTVATLWVKP